MKSFEPEFFQGNRKRLRELFTGTAPIVLSANGLMQKSADSSYPFKQDSNFWYLTGIDEPNVILVLDKNKEYLIVPDLSSSRIAFDGDIDIDSLRNISGISDILHSKNGWKQLEARVKKSSSVALVSPSNAYIESLGMFTNPARRRLISKLKKINPNLEFLDIKTHLGRMRMVKQQFEIDAIQIAINSTINAINYVEKKYLASAYSNEFEIEMDLNKQFWKKNTPNHSFEPIIASGSKGLTLHPSGNTNDIRPGDQLLLDVGAEYNHYAADISRTWSLEPSKRFKVVHDAVVDVADFALDLLKPGVVLSKYEKQVEDYMGEKLRELGLIKTIEHDNVRQYFPHATSHFLGIDVHDMGDYEYSLIPGVVLTVEPGIYIPEENIAIRIEDDVLITNDGHLNLSTKLMR